MAPISSIPMAALPQYAGQPMMAANLPMGATPQMVGPNGQVTPVTAQELPLPTAAQATAYLAAQGIKPPSTVKTLLKNVLTAGAAGAAAGAGVGFVGLFGIGAPIGAAVGGALGVTLGAIRGISQSRHQKQELAALVRSQQMAQVAAQQQQQQHPQPSVIKASHAPPVHKAAKPKKKGKAYTIKSGDTLSKIAAKHHTTWDKVYKANKAAIGSNPGKIHVGIKLIIPSK